jgi:hypothetical protein
MDRLPRGLLITTAACLTLSGLAEAGKLLIHGLPPIPVSAPPSTAYHIGLMVGAVLVPLGKILWAPVVWLLLRRRGGQQERDQAR